MNDYERGFKEAFEKILLFISFREKAYLANDAPEKFEAIRILKEDLEGLFKCYMNGMKASKDE